MPIFLGVEVSAEAIVRASGAIPGDPNVPPTVIEGYELEMTLESRDVKVSRLLGIVQNCFTADAQNAIYNEIAAKYLPQLTSFWKTTGKAYSGVMSIINTVSHTPYFVRFNKTTAGSEIVSIHAHNMAQDPEIATCTNADHIGEVCQFLSTLLILQDPSSVSSEDRQLLVPRLTRWRREYKGRLAEETSDRCLSQLSGKLDLTVMMASVIRKGLEKGVESCRAQGCNVGQGGPSERVALSQCSSARKNISAKIGHTIRKLAL